MDVLIRSDGQLHPQKPKAAPVSSPPPPTKPAPAPAPSPPHSSAELPSAQPPWEDLLLIGITLLILRNCDRPDLPLLLALCYILFDQQFDLKKIAGMI